MVEGINNNKKETENIFIYVLSSLSQINLKYSKFCYVSWYA